MKIYSLDKTDNTAVVGFLVNGSVVYVTLSIKKYETNANIYQRAYEKGYAAIQYEKNAPTKSFRPEHEGIDDFTPKPSKPETLSVDGPRVIEFSGDDSKTVTYTIRVLDQYGQTLSESQETVDVSRDDDGRQLRFSKSDVSESFTISVKTDEKNEVSDRVDKLEVRTAATEDALLSFILTGGN